MRTMGRPSVINAGIVVAVFCLHIALAPLTSLGVDEAHYALYAFHPALSYFDHPPMVGWLQMLISPFGFNELTLRIIPALLFALISLQLWRLMSLFYPEGSPWQSTLALFMVNSAPILQLLGWGMVPDWPLILIALLFLEQVYKLLQENHGFYRWLLIGILLGLAGLSKYTAVFLPLGLLLVLVHYQGVRWLLSPYPWCAALIALLLVSPVLIWNYQHQWVSFHYQLNHARGADWRWGSLLSMQLLQIACYTLLTYFGGIVASLSALQERRVSDWIIICLVWPFLLVTNWSSGHGEVLPNWPALGWVLITPLTAHWLCERWSRGWVKTVTIFSALLSVPLVLFLFVLLAFKPLDRFPFLRPVMKDLVGWREAAEQAARLREEYKDPALVLLVENWSMLSRVAFYAYPLPVQLLDKKQTQFDDWYGRPNAFTKGILVRAELSGEPEPSFVRDGLHCQLISQNSSYVGQTLINRFQFYFCQPPS